MIAVAIINFITLICNRKDKILLFSYLLAIASSVSYYIDISYIGILYILAALLIEIQVLRENMIYSYGEVGKADGNIGLKGEGEGRGREREKGSACSERLKRRK